MRVEMTIRDDVPLPDDVQATIEPLTLIGERNVAPLPAVDRRDGGRGPAPDRRRRRDPARPHLGAGRARRGPGGLQRPRREPRARRWSTSSSPTRRPPSRGRARNIATAIDQAASLTSLFASLDTQLVAAAENLDAVAASLNTRDAQLRTLVTVFRRRHRACWPSERDAIATFLRSLVEPHRPGPGDPRPLRRPAAHRHRQPHRAPARRRPARAGDRRAVRRLPDHHRDHRRGVPARHRRLQPGRQLRRPASSPSTRTSSTTSASCWSRSREASPGARVVAASWPSWPSPPAATSRRPRRPPATSPWSPTSTTCRTSPAATRSRRPT